MGSMGSVYRPDQATCGPDRVADLALLPPCLVYQDWVPGSWHHPFPHARTGSQRASTAPSCWDWAQHYCYPTLHTRCGSWHPTCTLRVGARYSAQDLGLPICPEIWQWGSNATVLLTPNSGPVANPMGHITQLSSSSQIDLLARLKGLILRISGSQYLGLGTLHYLL